MVICLGWPSPATSSSLPAACPVGVGHTSPLIWPCSDWGLPCHRRCRRRGGLLPHRFTLTHRLPDGRSVFCGPVRRLSAPRRYLAVYPVELGLSSRRPRRSRPSRSTSARNITRKGGEGGRGIGRPEVIGGEDRIAGPLPALGMTSDPASCVSPSATQLPQPREPLLRLVHEGLQGGIGRAPLAQDVLVLLPGLRAAAELLESGGPEQANPARTCPSASRSRRSGAPRARSPGGCAA